MSDAIPDPIVLISRPTKGCNQYTFNTPEELLAWTSRKPYCNETLLVMPMFNRQMLARKLMPAGEAHGYVCKLVDSARVKAEAAQYLAKHLLQHVANESEQCAHWMVSALSKLQRVQPNMQLHQVLEFVRQAMPEAAESYDRYVADKS